MATENPHLPAQLTPFIGRHAELAETTRLLADPACRLLTLAGPGGIGKTRLAIEIAAALSDRFRHGVAFVPLQGVESPELLPTAVADALNLAPAGQEAPLDRLRSYLHKKQMLLVLDNFEQLLDAAPLLTQILQAAPQVKMIVTTRERLRLRSESLYPVGGLAVPADAAVAEWTAYDAVQLFTERARRAAWDFSAEANPEAVIEICRLAEGMPLAIELAASWLQTLSVTDVAAEIRRNLDFLATTLRDVPQRHRSIRAIFEHTWQQLSAEERTTFTRLSVFRGGFNRDAAAAVAQATIPVLATLVDKSLLRRETNGRYQIHELLRQFAADRLAQSPDDLDRTRSLHADFYTRFLGDRFQAIIGGDQRGVMSAIAAELDNVRTAWQWAAAGWRTLR